MKSLLKDLIPGDEFEYVNTKPAYRVGKFLVLGDDNSYLRPVAVDICRFLFSYTTKKVVHHFEEQEVIKKETNVKTENKMGHFVGWKFGIPVRVYEHNPGGVNYPEYEEGRLVHEYDKGFVIIFDGERLGYRLKHNFHYELIPHKAGVCEPRYPVCQSNENTAYCNADHDGMSRLNVYHKLDLVPISTATLTIDGKTIELSAGTTANIKAELGI